MFTCQVSWHVAGHASSPICPLPLALSQTHPPLLLLLGHHFLLLLHVQQPSHPSSVPHTLFLHRRFLLFGIFDSSSDEVLIFQAFLFSRAVSFVVFSSREQRNFSFSSFFLLHLHHDRAANLSAHLQHVRETVYKSNARGQIAHQARRGTTSLISSLSSFRLFPRHNLFLQPTILRMARSRGWRQQER